MATCESCGKPVADDAPACGACGAARGARVLRPSFGSGPQSGRPASGRGPAPVVRIPLAPKRHVDAPPRAWGPGGGRGARVVATPGGSEALAPRTAHFQDTSPDTGTHPIVAPRSRAAEPPPRDPTEPPRDRKDPSTGSVTTQRRAACGPPVLASQALKEDLKPTQPGSRVVRVVAVALGLFGALVTVLLSGLGVTSAIGGAALLACAAVGAAPLPYRTRALALLGASSVGVLVTGFGTAAQVVPAAWLVAAFVPALAGGLFFRSAYRASKTARAVVAVGIALGVAWLAAGGALGAISDVLSGGTPTVAKVLGAWVAVPLVLALLAFMGPDSTAAGRVTGSLLLAWLGLYAFGAAVPLTWPPTPLAVARAGVVGIAFPELATLAALSFAQVLVCLRGGGGVKSPAAA